MEEGRNNVDDGILNVVLMPYCKNLGVYGAPFQEGPGVMARMLYGGRPSPIFNLKAVGNAYAASVAEEEDFPVDWDGVSELYGFRFTYTDAVDPDDTGLLVKNAVAFFMNLEEKIITDWLILLEDMLRWRVEWYDGDNDTLSLPKIVVTNDTNMNIVFEKDVNFSCSVSVRAGPQDIAKITDVTPPVYPKRFVIMKISSETPEYVDITFTGNCKPFTTDLAAKKVPVKNLKRQASDMYYERFYTLLEYKVDKKEKRDFILKDILENTFHGCPVCMKVAGDTFTGAALQLLESLKELPHVYY